MIEIRRFTETDNEFKELARVDNLVNHDSISHPDYDKDTWKIRDQSIIRDRILLYSSNTLIGVVYYIRNRVRFLILNAYKMHAYKLHLLLSIKICNR